MAGAGEMEEAGTYDEMAQKVAWQGPARVTDLLLPFVRQGQRVLDIGTGTGLGSEYLAKAGLRVTGMDISDSMLAVCRKKGFVTRLVRHDLTVTPYPFDDSSFDHVVSTGVFQFFPCLDTVFREVARLTAPGGRFAFVTADRTPGQPMEIVAGPELTGTGHAVTMYRHSPAQVAGWLEKNGFRPVDSVPFMAWMDEKRTRELPVRAYLAEKIRDGRRKTDGNPGPGGAG